VLFDDVLSAPLNSSAPRRHCVLMPPPTVKGSSTRFHVAHQVRERLPALVAVDAPETPARRRLLA
jgi:hypothetical protein